MESERTAVTDEVDASTDVVLRGEVVSPVEDRLRVLAETIVREHEATRGAAEAMVLHAVACGEALLEAKTLVPVGKWTSWVEANFPYDKRRAMCGNYMRLAALKQHVDPELSITANLHLVRGLEARSSATPRLPPEMKEEALRLWATGEYKQAQIARLVGTTKDTVRAWIDPDHARRKAARSNARRQARKVAEREEPNVPGRDERALRYGEPGRAAIGKAVRRVAQAQGAHALHDALLDLSAICLVWAGRIAPRNVTPTDNEMAA